MQLGRIIRLALFIGISYATSIGSAVYATTLVIESWRVDDKTIWETVLIPAFEKKYPGIQVKFSPSAPTEYDGSLATRLNNGGAGDIIACRPFDVSLSLYRKGHLDKLNGKNGMQYFPSTSLVAWQTDDAKETFCMPVASVIHGFLYNKNIFKKLNLSVPTTQAEFFNALNIIKKNSSYLPLALGTADRWESSQTVFTNIGPTFWHGEEGRKALIAGKAKFTDTSFLAALDFEAKLATYLPKNVGTQTYSESQNLFAQGRAAIFPLGSWDIAYFNQVAGLEFGVFAPPVKTSGDQCVISDHMDIGLGINKHSKNKEDAYKFLAWIGSQEFAALYTNRMTGFFTLSNHLIALDDPIAKQMLDWRNQCLSTIRLSSQALNRGTPNMETALWNINADVLNGNLNAKEAAFKLQTEFAKWQKPLHP